MKKIFIILITFSFLYVCCTEDVTEMNRDLQGDDINVDSNCCGVSPNYRTMISGNKLEDGSYYWLGLLYNDLLLKHSDSTYVIDDHFSNVPLNINVNRSIGNPSDVYSVRAFGTDSPEYVGMLTNQKSYIEVGLVSQLDSCVPCCHFSGRKYCHLIRTVDNGDIVGVKAKIKTQYGQLCKQPDGTEAAMSCVWVTAAVSSPYYNPYWAQIGYSYERLDGYTEVRPAIYIEVWGGEYEVKAFYSYTQVPLWNDEWTYQCELDTTDWKWSFKINNFSVFVPIYSDGWSSTTAKYARWSSEIFNIEDDMVGTFENTCQITECCVKRIGADYDNIIINEGDGTHDYIQSDNDDEWGVESLYPDGIEIWDKNPLP